MIFRSDSDWAARTDSSSWELVNTDTSRGSVVNEGRARHETLRWSHSVITSSVLFQLARTPHPQIIGNMHRSGFPVPTLILSNTLVWRMAWVSPLPFVVFPAPRLQARSPFCDAPTWHNPWQCSARARVRVSQMLLYLFNALVMTKRWSELYVHR